MKGLLLFGLLFIVSSTAFCQDSTSTNKGKKIGGIIKAAINTALPGISDLIKLIWNKPDNQTMNKTEVTNQLTNTRTQLFAQAQEKLEPINDKSAELSLINTFLIPSVRANNILIGMQTRLSRQTPLTAADWTKQSDELEGAADWIGRIKSIDDNKINSINDTYIRSVLVKIRDANTDPLRQLRSAVKAKDAKIMSELLTLLIGSLNDIPIVVGYELADLQGDMKELGKWAGGGQGGPSGLNEQQGEYKKILIKKYPEN